MSSLFRFCFPSEKPVEEEEFSNFFTRNEPVINKNQEEELSPDIVLKPNTKSSNPQTFTLSIDNEANNNLDKEFIIDSDKVIVNNSSRNAHDNQEVLASKYGGNMIYKSGDIESLSPPTKVNASSKFNNIQPSKFKSKKKYLSSQGNRKESEGNNVVPNTNTQNSTGNNVDNAIRKNIHRPSFKLNNNLNTYTNNHNNTMSPINFIQPSGGSNTNNLHTNSHNTNIRFVEPINILNSNQGKVTDIEVQSNPKLELIEVEGNIIAEKKLLMNAGGLVKGSLRNAKDGWTYFGLVKKGTNGEIANDYILNMQAKVPANTIFKLFFDRMRKEYYLTSGNSTDEMIIVFVKLVKPFKLFKKHIISMGEIHMSTELDRNNNLKIEIVYGNEETKVKTFLKSHGRVVKIGRNKDNEIILDNFSFSRVHTSFWYSSIDDSWHVQDGLDKCSTNGSWIYLDWNWPIDQKTCFRIGTNSLCLNLVSNA